MASRRLIALVASCVLVACGTDLPATRDGPSGDEPSVLNDRGPVGSLGPALLDPSIAAVTVEVDTTPERSLGDGARAALETNLREHGKKDEVAFGGSADLPSRERYTRSDLERLAADHRSVSSTRQGLGIHLLVLAGSFEDRDTLGVAFGATTVAIFPDRIAAGLLATLRYDRVEKAVVVHELGHLFGLVNLTGEGVFHEDPEHRGHSANEGSVMYWAVEDIDVATVFSGGPPSAFDADDRAEMDRIRA